MVGEAEQQHTTTTAAHTEELVGSKETELVLSSRKERVWTDGTRPK